MPELIKNNPRYEESELKFVCRSPAQIALNLTKAKSETRLNEGEYRQSPARCRP